MVISANYAVIMENTLRRSKSNDAKNAENERNILRMPVVFDPEACLALVPAMVS
jgi:hypothetical protein